MKKILIIIVIFVLLAAGGLFAYHYFSENSDALSHDLTSTDGRYTISVPPSVSETEPSSDGVVLQASNKKETLYTSVKVDSAMTVGGDTLEGYCYNYIAALGEKSDDPLVQTTTVYPTECILGENTGCYYELDTMSEGVALHVWEFVLADNGSYVHVSVACEGDEQNTWSETAKDILNSLKINL